MMLFKLLLIATGAFAETKSLVVLGQNVTVNLNARSAQIICQFKTHSAQSVKLASFREAKIKTFSSFKVGSKTLLFLDYDMGIEFGSRFEKNCSKAILWEVSKRACLTPVQEEIYRCEVNSSEEYYKNQEFLYTIKLNKALGKIEYVR